MLQVTEAPTAIAKHNPKNAVAFIRLIEPVLAALGYHTALTGSVLYKGGSEKDTDVIIYPHDPDKNELSPDEIIEALKPVGVVPRYKTTKNYVNRDVRLCAFEGRRIDFFFL